MSDTREKRSFGAFETKSRVGELTRQIDTEVRNYVSSGDHKVVAKVAKLARQKEQLLKPDFIRSGKIRKTG